MGLTLTIVALATCSHFSFSFRYISPFTFRGADSAGDRPAFLLPSVSARYVTNALASDNVTVDRKSFRASAPISSMSFSFTFKSSPLMPVLSSSVRGCQLYRAMKVLIGLASLDFLSIT